MAAANNEKYGTLGKVAAGAAAELAKTKKLADGLEKRKIRDKGKVVMYSDAPPLQKSSTPSLRVVSAPRFARCSFGSPSLQGDEKNGPQRDVTH